VEEIKQIVHGQPSPVANAELLKALMYTEADAVDNTPIPQSQDPLLEPVVAGTGGITEEHKAPKIKPVQIEIHHQRGIGFTSASHEESKKRRKMARASRKKNRK